MYRTIDVKTGTVQTITGEGVIKSSGLGSCVAVVAYNPRRQVGGIAHVMLPGNYPKRSHKHPTRYCAQALDELLDQLEEKGAHNEDLVVCLAGGANVLQRDNCTIGRENLEALKSYLNEKGIKTAASRSGGLLWRSVRLNLDTGEIVCSEAGRRIMLWSSEKK